MKYLLSLVKSSLDCIVLHIELVGDAHCLIERLVGNGLLSADILNVACKS